MKTPLRILEKETVKDTERRKERRYEEQQVRGKWKKMERTNRKETLIAHVVYSHNPHTVITMQFALHCLYDCVFKKEVGKNRKSTLKEPKRQETCPQSVEDILGVFPGYIFIFQCVSLFKQQTGIIFSFPFIAGKLSHKIQSRQEVM